VTSFNEQLDDRLDRGDRPGVALVPQPGVVVDLVRRGVAVGLPDDVVANVDETHQADLVDLVSRDGIPAAVWVNVDVKGLVWYRPSVFAERGLSPPTTLDELAELSESIRTADDRVAPWCITIEAGASTGWVGTDWVEGYALRRLGADGYDRWTAGDLPFDGEQVGAVFDELDGLLRSPGAVAGGSRAVLTTPWERAADGLFAEPPRCAMVHQADFLRREFPAGTTIGPDGDIDFFVLPAAGSEPPPLLLGGNLAVPLDDRPEVDEAMRLLTSAEFATMLDRTGEFVSPHTGIDRSDVGGAVSTRLIDLVAGAGALRFDGSDLMPASVGTGTFWAGMQSFFSGERVDTVLPAIEAGWADAPPITTDG
jgi:alpha-glucoside transport system substrate-binding protein